MGGIGRATAPRSGRRLTIGATYLMIPHHADLFDAANNVHTLQVTMDTGDKLRLDGPASLRGGNTKKLQSSVYYHHRFANFGTKSTGGCNLVAKTYLL